MNSNKTVTMAQEYLSLRRELDKLESGLSLEKESLTAKYTSEYTRLKAELKGFILKTNQTIQTVCNIHRAKVQMANGRIYASGSAPTVPYSCQNACKAAIAAGNEAVKLLSAVINRVNLDVSLYQLAQRYNTVAEIYENADSLCREAVEASLKSHLELINNKKKKMNEICKSEDEFRTLFEGVLANAEELCDRCIINDKLDPTEEMTQSPIIPLGLEYCDAQSLGVDDDLPVSSLDWELERDGIAVIRASGKVASSSEIAQIGVDAITHFLFSYPLTYKRVLICDSHSTSLVTTFAGCLKNGGQGLFFDGGEVKNSDEDIRKSIGELNRIINERIMLLGQSVYSDILEYNMNNQDNPQPLIMAVLNGYPGKYESGCDELASALKNGKKAGVFFLIAECTDENEESRYYRKKLPDLDALTRNIMTLEGKGSSLALIKDGKKFSPNLRGQGYNITSVLSVFKDEVKKADGKIVYLDSVVGNEDFDTSKRRNKFSETLSIPIGKQGANPISIDLSAKNAPHIAVIGTTGSGKTAFINSLVLSACKLYSPQELELHLIVMVKGDFKVFEECKLPHLKTVVTGDRIFAATDVLDFLDEEMKRRGNLIGSLGNIYAYNEVATVKLPRCVVIIDEFLQLVAGSDDAIKRIEAIAQVGRAYGMSLVISSTSFPMEVNSIKHLFEHKFEFKSGDNAGQLIPEASARQAELVGTSGLCFYSCKGNLYSLRVAYSEESQRLKDHITSIKEKFHSSQMELQSDIKAFKVSCEEDVPFLVKNPKNDYCEGTIRTRLGKTYLSNKPLEYPFDSKNNLLFLFGHYLDTKAIEASLIKDTLVLSRDVDEAVVYYIDMNKNTALKRQKTIIKELRDSWVLSGKMVYCGNDEVEDTLDEIKELIDTRENDEDSELYPVLVMIVKAESAFEDDDMCETLCELFNRGRENNVYFAVQCGAPVRFYGSDKLMNDAVIFPDRYKEGESYSSSSLCSALEEMPAGATDKGRKLIANATRDALHPKLHILCNNNKLSMFIPYEYERGYLDGIV